MKYYLGIDLGGTNIAAGVVDENYRIIAQFKQKTVPSKSFEDLVADIAQTGKRAVEAAGLTMDAIASVGLGTPSCINPQTQLLVNANNLGWRNVPLVAQMKKHFSVPVFICNDADCAALGEVLAGAAKGYDNALMVTLGTGVGGGVIMERKIFNGCDHMGAEIGHTKLVFQGILCSCGQAGCFESYASAPALTRQAREALAKNPQSIMVTACGGDVNNLEAKTVFDAARGGDAVAADVIDGYTAYLAAGLSTLITIFRPQVIIIGGGVSSAGDTLFEPLNKKIFTSTFAAQEIGVPKAIAAVLKNDAGIIGAAMLGNQ